jgi:hypothetical protein
MALLSVTIVPTAAFGQGTTYARASVSSAYAFDDNLFAVADQPEADVIVRFGPAFEAGYVSRPLALAARYAFDSERYLHHDRLNKNVGRQDAAIELRHELTKRLAMNVRGAFLETQTPRDFNLASGIAAGLAPATRASANASATYEWNRANSLNVDYEFARDAVVGGVGTEHHTARVGVDRRFGIRNSRRIDYRVRSFVFDDHVAKTAHVITIGWAHALTKLMGVEVDLGPRLSERTVRPEISALLRGRLKRGEVSVGYSRTQTTAVGETGAIELERAVVGFTAHATSHFTLTASPSFVRAGHVSVYGFDVQAVARATRSVSIVTSARAGLQEGTLSGGSLKIPNRTVSLKLIATLPGSSHPDSRRRV